MLRYTGRSTPEDMGKQFLAKGLEQRLFRNEMSLERSSAHICLVYNLLYGDSAEALLGKEGYESLEDGITRFLLSSVH